MPRSFVPVSLLTAEELLRLRWPNPQARLHHDHRDKPLTPGQGLALTGLMCRKTSATLDLWQQAVAQGFDLQEGAAWVVHVNRGDLVRPLAERFGFDWAQELNRPRAPARGHDRPLNALSQALYQPSVRMADQPEESAWRAPSVVAAWEALDLDPTQRLRTEIALYAGVRTPVNTLLDLPLNWLGIALACGAWSLAKRLMNDPRILADHAGLSQALFVWTVTAWQQKAPLDHDRNEVGPSPENDSYWPKRLLAAGARVNSFPWVESEVHSTRMQFSKGEPRTHTWAQSVPHYRWLSPTQRQAMDAERENAPLWSTAHWAARNAALGYDKQRQPLWHLLKTDMELWARMPHDGHGQSMLSTVLLQGETLAQVGAPLQEVNARKARPKAWQGEAVVHHLVEACPQRTQDELLSALYLGVAQGQWGLLRCFTDVRTRHPGSVPEQGFFTDEELGALMDTLLVVAYPVEFCRYGARLQPSDQPRQPTASRTQGPKRGPLPNSANNPRSNPESDLRTGQNDDDVVKTWWIEEAPAFAGWLSPPQQTVWQAWCAQMADALPNARFPYPRQTKNQSKDEHDALYNAYLEQRDLMATLACEEAFERLHHHQEPVIQPTRNRSRL